MYDTLIAERLSSADGQFGNKDASSEVRWGPATINTNTKNSSPLTSGPNKKTLQTILNGTAADISGSSGGGGSKCDWKTSKLAVSSNGSSSNSNGGRNMELNSNNNNKTIPSTRNSVNHRHSGILLNRWAREQQQILVNNSNSSSNCGSSSGGCSNKNDVPSKHNQQDEMSQIQGLVNGSSSGVATTTKGMDQRPLSVNSVVSSTSSSSCSSESSSSLGHVLGLVAPRASPEQEECNITVPAIPDVDISDDDETSGNPSSSINYRCAKKSNSDQINSTENNRCFSNSAAKDCGETATTSRGRISYPIQAQGKPKFYDPNLSYMDRVVMEIAETERVYVNDLQEIISGYLHYWRDETEKSLAFDDIKELFSNIEEIHNFNSEFLTRLEGCGLNPVGVARCFVTKNEGFSIYTQYCTNYPRTMSILTEMMRHEQSAKSFRERQASLGHSLPLGSYLLKPVQRILKYHLLLQNIVKHFDHGTEGYETIVEALSAMTNIAHHINDMKRRHEHAVRVQEIQSLLYGWQGEDLTTYGELCAEGTFRAYGAKALRHVFLFDKMLLITKKKEDGILCYKTHIMCSNLMLIESVPGEPLSFHVIPFDNPRLQCTLQGRNLEQKREWTLQLKRVILENYHAVIPTHARQLVMELGQYRPEESGSEKVPTKRQHSAPEYLERRKQEKDRRKSESSLKARLRRARKSDLMSPKESLGGGRRSRKNSTDSSRERSESRDSREREVSIDRKMSSASCPPSGSTEKRLVKKLSGWRRKSEPGIYHHHQAGKSGKGDGLMSPTHGTSNLTLDSTESIGEEEGEFLEEPSIQTDLCHEENELDETAEECLPNVEERRESVEEIVGQLVMQNIEFQRILNKQRLVHLRKALTQYQRKHSHEEESASETETEEQQDNKNPVDCKNTSSGSNASQGSSSNGIGSSSDMAEMSSENISIGPNDDVILTSKNVQRTVSDPGNKATLTPRRFMNGPFAHYDPLSLLWSSFRRNDNRTNKQGDSPVKSKGKTNIRHTHSFTCTRKESNHQGPDEDTKDPLPLPHGDSGVFPNSFTSDSSSSSEANIPTLPAVWLKQQDEHLATPNNKSGSLPRSFQVSQPQQSLLTPQLGRTGPLNLKNPDEMANPFFKSRLRDGKFPDRPITIASDKPSSSSNINYDEMEHYMNKFNDQNCRKSPSSTNVEDVDDLATELTPVTSMESINTLHPDHKIYRPSKSSIKHMLLSVTHRLSGLKVNMLTGGSNNSSRGNVSFGSYPNISTTSVVKNRSKNGTEQTDVRKMSNGNGLNMLPRNYRKSLKQKLRNIVREDRDSDSENCESVTCSSGSSGFGSIGSCESTNNLTSKIGARLAQSSEQSDYTLSKLLGSALNESLNRRPHSVMSVSSTVTSTSSTDDKMSSGLGESLSGSSSHLADNGISESQDSFEEAKTLYRSNRKAINHRDLYQSYIDQEAEVHSDSDASADSFYERSFEAIESLLESEFFPDSAIYSADENASTNSSGCHSSNWAISSSHDGSEASSMSPAKRQYFSNAAELNSISMLAARLSNSRQVPNDDLPTSQRSRLIRSQAILEKLKHLEACSQFHREELPSPSFEGIKSIQERRKELELWKQGRTSRGEDECETSSQHSTSTINTVIELSPSKSTSFPSSRRCSDTDSSGGNSPLTERAISRSSSRSNGNLIGDPMPKGWVKLLVGKLQAAEFETTE